MDVRDHCQMITLVEQTVHVSSGHRCEFWGARNAGTRPLAPELLLDCPMQSRGMAPKFQAFSTLRSLFPVHDYAEVAGAADGRVGVVGEIDARGQIVIRGQL